MPDRDRLEALMAPEQTKLTGLRFIYVHKDELTLCVHFHKPPSDLTAFKGIGREHIRIFTPDGIPDRKVVRVQRVRWVPECSETSSCPEWPAAMSDNDSRPVTNDILAVCVDRPRDFGPFVLEIVHPNVDPYYGKLTFSFKAHCESDVDCRQRTAPVATDDAVDFPVDYQVKDFDSFHRALLEFAAQRYPHWRGRGIEADVGYMLTEVMSALGDEFSYYQDRVAREAYLETATERRSLRKHARLVDYHVHDGLGASTWIDVCVNKNMKGVIAAGFSLHSEAEEEQRVTYEIGSGLRAIVKKQRYAVDDRLNELMPYLWDEGDTKLPRGAAEIYVQGHCQEAFSEAAAREGDSWPGGRYILLRSDTSPALKEKYWVCRVTDVEDTDDPIFGKEITRLAWEKSEALPFEFDLESLEIRANLVPAVAGTTLEKQLVIGEVPATVPYEKRKDIDLAVTRGGIQGAACELLLRLQGSDERALVWSGEDPRSAQPEIELVEEYFDVEVQEWVAPRDRRWHWKHSFLDAPSSQSNDRDFILEDGSWERVVGYQRGDRELVHRDYKNGRGMTVRLGNGEFGFSPPVGTVFRLRYRLGNGKKGNVSAGALCAFDATAVVLDEKGEVIPAEKLIIGLANPLSVENGVEPETTEDVRQTAPEWYRAWPLRAITAGDYETSAERLPWVQRAGARFRWTGSWLSAFVTPDPLGASELESAQRDMLAYAMDRVRQTGRDVFVLQPRYANLNLSIRVCVEPHAYREHVKESVLEALTGATRGERMGAFFHPDNFTFGTPLIRSSLEAAIQRVPGVRAVEDIHYARRGWFEEKRLEQGAYAVSVNEMIRVDNDPLFSNRGSVRLEMVGGA